MGVIVIVSVNECQHMFQCGYECQSECESVHMCLFESQYVNVLV